MGKIHWFYMSYFKPTIDFNMLQYITSSDFQVPDPLQVFHYSNDLPAGPGLLVDFKDLIILERSKCIMHAIF